MVTDYDAIRAMLDRERSVLAGDDAFEQHLHLGAFLELIHVVPGHASKPQAYPRHVHAVEHGAHGEGARELRVANLAARVVGRIEAAHELEIARRNVDGPGNRGAARVLG